MCLNLVGSQFKSIDEVETLLNRTTCKLTEKDILAIKDDRKAIQKELRISRQLTEIDELFC